MKIALAIAIAFASYVAAAQGLLIETDEIPQRDHQGYTIREHHVRIAIKDGTAETTVEQLFQNNGPRPIMADYMFPLPDGAAVSNFSMSFGDRKIEAKLLNAAEARRIFESIVRRRQDPALLEFAGRSVLRARVFPIPAGESRRITVTYSQTLRRDAGIDVFDLALRPLRGVQKPIESLTIDADVRTTNPITTVYCPSHAEAIVRRTSDYAATVTLRASQTLPERDFQLYIGSSAKAFDARVIQHRDRGDGYFLLLLGAGKQAPTDAMPKQVMFVLDRTGSMSGEKLRQAKQAFKYCLESLRERDRFNLIYFNEQPTVVFESLVAANSDNVRRAIEEVDKLDARGGTNIHDSLSTAFERFPIDRMRAFRAVVFLTDGLPTVGETAITKILDRVRSLNQSKVVRLFCFGVGYDVNVPLLDKLAEQNGGTTEYVRPDENIESKLGEFSDRIQAPALMGVELRGEGMYDVYPPLPVDLFHGQQLVLAGRYRTTGRLTIEGQSSEGRVALTVDLRSDATGGDYAPRLWAMRKVGYLMDEWRLNKNPEVEAEILRLAKEHGIVTPFTSFLIDDDMIAWDGRAPREDVKLRFRSTNEAAQRDDGEGSVRASQNAYGLKGAGGGGSVQQKIAAGESVTHYNEQLGYDAPATLADKAQAKMRNVGGKTFYLQNDVWTDSQLDNGAKTIVIQPFSQAHFDLIERRPSLRQYATVGDKAIIQLPKAAVKFDRNGKTKLSAEEWKLIGEEPKDGKKAGESTALSLGWASLPLALLGLLVYAVKKR
ncbi:MAG: VWA domain-containing protein [Armatimonadetes bacterium]|nr:VWA domain-containing protein [Armatimonadota bacterium]